MVTKGPAALQDVQREGIVPNATTSILVVKQEPRASAAEDVSLSTPSPEGDLKGNRAPDIKSEANDPFEDTSERCAYPDYDLDIYTPDVKEECTRRLPQLAELKHPAACELLYYANNGCNICRVNISQHQRLHQKSAKRRSTVSSTTVQRTSEHPHKLDENYLITNTGEKLYSCEECNLRLGQSGSLVKHVVTHTGLRFTCEDCKKEFPEKYILINHKRIHTGEKPFACKECGNKYSYIGNLRSHMQSHVEKKPFSCEHCKKLFVHKRSLLAHKITHTEAKPFACGTCPKSFYRRACLLKHAMIHAANRPFECEDCKRQFTEKRFLVYHKKTHSSEKAFSCKECDKEFHTKARLNSHARTHNT